MADYDTRRLKELLEKGRGLVSNQPIDYTRPDYIEDVEKQSLQPTTKKTGNDTKDKGEHNTQFEELLKRYNDISQKRDLDVDEARRKQRLESGIKGILEGGAIMGSGLVAAAGGGQYQDPLKSPYQVEDKVTPIQEDYKQKLAGQKDLLDLYSKLQRGGGTGKNIYKLGSQLVRIGPDGSPMPIYEDPYAEKKMNLYEGKEKRLGKQFEHKVKEGDEPTPKQVEYLRDIAIGEEQIEQVKKLLPKVEDQIGPFASKFSEARKYLPGMEKTPEFTDLQQRIGTQLSDYIKRISGAAVSEEEAKRLSKNIPTVDDNPGEFKVKLKNFMEELQRAKARHLEALEKGGRDISKFKETISDSTSIKQPTQEQIDKFSTMHNLDKENAKQILIKRLNK